MLRQSKILFFVTSNNACCCRGLPRRSARPTAAGALASVLEVAWRHHDGHHIMPNLWVCQRTRACVRAYSFSSPWLACLQLAQSMLPLVMLMTRACSSCNRRSLCGLMARVRAQRLPARPHVPNTRIHPSSTMSSSIPAAACGSLGWAFPFLWKLPSCGHARMLQNLAIIGYGRRRNTHQRPKHNRDKSVWLRCQRSRQDRQMATRGSIGTA